MNGGSSTRMGRDGLGLVLGVCCVRAWMAGLCVGKEEIGERRGCGSLFVICDYISLMLFIIHRPLMRWLLVGRSDGRSNAALIIQTLRMRRLMYSYRS